MSKRLGIIGMFVVIGFTLGGIAYAVVPVQSDGDSVIHGCVQKSNGGLRVVDDASQCRKNEKPLDWNAQGAKGDQGDAATSQAYEATGSAVLGEGSTQVAALTLPAGNYVLFAKADITGTPAEGGLMAVQCAIQTSAGPDGRSFDVVNGSFYGPAPNIHILAALEATAQFESTATVQFVCLGDPMDHPQADFGHVIAIKVDQINPGF